MKLYNGLHIPTHNYVIIVDIMHFKYGLQCGVFCMLLYVGTCCVNVEKFRKGLSIM